MEAEGSSPFHPDSLISDCLAGIFQKSYLYKRIVVDLLKMRTFKRVLGVLVILFVVAIVYSLLFPGKIRFVDNMRMFVQRPPH